MKDFHVKSRAAWVDAIKHTVGAHPANKTIWEGPEAIRNALTAFMGRNNNHTHLPTGGGQDFNAVDHSRESGCLDFKVGERTIYRAKAERLTLVYIPEEPAESFLFLEAGTLSPLTETGSRLRQEEMLELSNGQRMERYVWDRGYIDHDSDGHEIPIPGDARLVVRWLGGKFLLVTKGSLWNGDSSTYDGRHDKMSPDDIRTMILKALV